MTTRQTVTLTTQYSDRTTTIAAEVDANDVVYVSRRAVRNAERRVQMISGDYLTARLEDGSRAFYIQVV